MSDRFWDYDRIVRFAKLWAEGLSYDEIGHCLGVTAKAVQLKRSRLKLPPRSSGGQPRRKRRAAPIVIPPKIKTILSPRRFDSSIPWPSKQQLMAGR